MVEIKVWTNQISKYQYVFTNSEQSKYGSKAVI